MTKKDYILIAGVLKAHSHSPSVRDFALDLARALQQENPRFNLIKFLMASGIATGSKAA